MASEDQQPILDMATRIAEAFINAYHEDENAWKGIPAAADDEPGMGLTPHRNSMRGALAVMGALGIHAGGEGQVLLGGSIWTLEYNTQQDSYSGWYWDSNIDEDWGYFLTEKAARDFADTLNRQNCTSAYNRARDLAQAKHERKQMESRSRAKQNEALRAAGLPEIEGNTTAHLAAFAFTPFEEWIKSYENSRESYYDIREIEIHKESE